MGANQVFLIIVAVSILAMLALMPATVKWGLKWANVADISYVRAIGLYLLFMLSVVVAGLTMCAFYFVPNKLPIVLSYIIEYAASFIVPVIVIAVVYKARLRQAAKAVIPFCLVGAALPFLSIALRTTVYEAFTIPGNSMAPTILGDHWEGVCPRCGQPTYGSPIDARRELPVEGVQMVCSKELTSVLVKGSPKRGDDVDRIMACKLLSPKRWDLVVFREPANPAMRYVKRLVGLPGEKLEIRDGAIWINGERLEPPDAIRGIHYSPTVESGGQTISGPGSVPVELGDDEYYVLGDFVDQSLDSRFWQGAPGHSPYAVPASHMVGVVINIYWPTSRWTSFR